MEVTPELLDAVRNYLDVTWQSEDTDKKLTGIIGRGMMYLNRAAGETLDYGAEDQPRELLLEYARYVWSNALDEYVTNYLPELMALQIQRRLRRHDQEQGADLL